LVNQIIKEHLDFHGLASQAKLYYLPKPFLMRLNNEYTEEELRELARETAKNDLVDISVCVDDQMPQFICNYRWKCKNTPFLSGLPK
jgi:hypothetical protein